jgi:ribonucleoside-diphosphate reductase alpha chain
MKRMYLKHSLKSHHLSIVQQAASRQKYIDQAQSLNLMIHPDVPAKDINSLIIEGWRLGVKTFYYQRSANPAQELVRDIMNCAVRSAKLKELIWTTS